MPQDKNRQFLDFEKPIKELFDEIEKLKQTAEKTKVDLTDSINKLYAQVTEKRREITANLTPWQKVQLSRHPGPAVHDEVYRKNCLIILSNSSATAMCGTIKPWWAALPSSTDKP